jgi:hypothetical protein
MVVKRNYNLSKVKDFLLNVRPILKSDDLPEEIYESKKLIGWRIEKLGGRGYADCRKSQTWG